MVTVYLTQCGMVVKIYKAEIYMKLMDVVAGRLEPFMFIQFIKAEYPDKLVQATELMQQCFAGIGA